MIEAAGLVVEYSRKQKRARTRWLRAGAEPLKAERALDGFTLSIPAREVLAIVGRSGCGKTTLLHALAGLIPLAAGEVRIDGATLRGPRRRTALLLQDHGLFPWKTAMENVALGAIAGNGNGHFGTSIDLAAKLSARRQLDALGIADCADKYPAELSGGQRQRVAIARALAQEPDLLLLDEPSASLDAMTKEAFQGSLLNLLVGGQDGRRGATIVLVTHDVEEAAYLASTIVVMERGRVSARFDNPLAREAGLRENLAYYEFCLNLRKAVGGLA